MSFIEIIFIAITFMFLVTFIVTSLIIFIKQKDRILKTAGFISLTFTICLTVALIIFIV